MSIHIQTIPPHLESMLEPLCMRPNATLQPLEPKLLSTNNCMGIKPSLTQRLESLSKNSSTRLEIASQAQPGPSLETSPTFPRSRIPLHSGQSSKNPSSYIRSPSLSARPTSRRYCSFDYVEKTFPSDRRLRSELENESVIDNNQVYCKNYS